MNAPLNETVPELIERLCSEMPTLSPQLVRVAEHVIESPQDLGWFGIVEFSECCGVPPATVVRFARRFRYSQFTDLRKLFRDSLRRHVNASMLLHSTAL